MDSDVESGKLISAFCIHSMFNDFSFLLFALFFKNEIHATASKISVHKLIRNITTLTRPVSKIQILQWSWQRRL